MLVIFEEYLDDCNLSFVSVLVASDYPRGLSSVPPASYSYDLICPFPSSLRDVRILKGTGGLSYVPFLCAIGLGEPETNHHQSVASMLVL